MTTLPLRRPLSRVSSLKIMARILEVRAEAAMPDKAVRISVPMARLLARLCRDALRQGDR